ncbi:hypothetical protein LLG88_13605 [bacterium]|nr:hypothetical protein [bacterium]
MRKSLWVVLVLTGLLIGAAPVAHAQAVMLNPTMLSFTPSPDHNATGLDGTPLVSRYEARVYSQGDLGLLLVALDLGKPTPVGNTITVVNAAWFLGLTPNVKLVIKVAAINTPTLKEGVSVASDPFGVQGPPQAGGKPATAK